MERDYYHSIDSFRFISAVCFVFFYFGLVTNIGQIMQYCFSFAVPFLYMTFGFLVLGERENRTEIIGRCLTRNTLLLGILFVVFSILSLVYLKITGVNGTVSPENIKDFFLYGSWPLPVGSTAWFTMELVISLAVFWLFSKLDLLDNRWFCWFVVIVTLAVNLLFGEFSEKIGLGTIPSFFLIHAMPLMLIGKLVRDKEEQILDLGVVIPAVTLVTGLLLTIGEILFFSRFTLFDFTSNYFGSIIVAVSVLMIAVLFPELGGVSGLGFWGGSCATWMFLLTQPVGMFINAAVTTTDVVITVLKPFLIFFICLIISLIISVILRRFIPRYHDESVFDSVDPYEEDMAFFEQDEALFQSNESNDD